MEIDTIVVKLDIYKLSGVPSGIANSAQQGIKNTPDPERVEFGLNFLSLSMANLTLTEQSVKMAKDFEKQGIKPIDALHLASAAENNIDYLALAMISF